MSQQYLHELIWEEIERQNAINKETYYKNSISSGFKNIDKYLKGFLPGKLYLLSGFESVGKTTFLLNLLVKMNSQIQEKRKIILYTPGMSASLVTQRIISCITGLKIDKITIGKLEQAEFKQFNALLMEHFSTEFPNCLINDQPILTVNYIANNFINSQESDRPEFIMIDDFPLIHSDKTENLDERISEIMINLKQLAEKFQIPILVTARLEKENADLPILSDLRLTGIFEQLADVVLFISYPICYEIGDTVTSHVIKGETHMRIAKNQFGLHGMVKFKAEFIMQQLMEMDENNFWIRGGDNTSGYES